MPSSWNQRILISCIASLGIFIALYLGLYQWHLIAHAWDPFFGSGTEDVLTSNVSHDITKIVRIPDAIFGVFAYLGDVLFALAGSVNRWRDRPWIVILFGISTIPLGIVACILVLMQAFVVKHFCFLCLCSAAISLSLIPLAYNEVICSLLYLKEVSKMRGRKTAIKAFWGTPADISIAASHTVLKRRYVA